VPNTNTLVNLSLKPNCSLHEVGWEWAQIVSASTPSTLTNQFTFAFYKMLHPSLIFINPCLKAWPNKWFLFTFEERGCSFLIFGHDIQMGMWLVAAISG
jgi:hypothetical protein